MAGCRSRSVQKRGWSYSWKIGSVAEVLNAINNDALKSTKDVYLQLDADLAAFNENPTTEDGE